MPALRSVVRVVLLSSIAAGLSLSLTSQNATPTTTLRVTSNLVFLDVTVVDRKGQPVVSGLTKDDFTITENGMPQRIFSFDARRASALRHLGHPHRSPDRLRPLLMLRRLGRGHRQRFWYSIS